MRSASLWQANYLAYLSGASVTASKRILRLKAYEYM